MWMRQTIFCDFKKFKSDWIKSHSYVPTAFLTANNIRVLISFWDKNKIGRIGFIDIDSNNPTKIIDYSKKPSLDVGEPGCFDEHGVTPLSIIRDKNYLRLYYAGWQRNKQYRYTLFTGLAISTDEGRSFERYQKTPIIGPTPQSPQVRTGGCVIYDNGIWKTWYAEAHGTIIMNNKKVPTYNLAYMESNDGINWSDKGIIVKKTQENKIFGYGRSAIVKINQKYHAWMSVRTYNGYKIGYCHSADGINWSNFDFFNKGLEPNAQSCSENLEVAFPSLIIRENTTCMFYNGNNYGENGIMVATTNTEELFNE